MIINTAYSLPISEKFSVNELINRVWLVVIHASRKPPHVGVLINGKYNSLTLKGIENDLDINVILKSVNQKKIETVFILLKKHPVFSEDYQKEIFKLYLSQFKKVTPFEASCVSPVKLFLNEFYALNSNENDLFFEIVERLKQNKFIDSVFGLNLKKPELFSFSIYNYEELQHYITNEIQQNKIK